MKTKGLILSMLFLIAFAGTGKSQVKSSGTLPCIQGISNLTGDQQKQIIALEETYQSKMEEYRIERRSTADIQIKNEIYADMQQAKADHRNEVLKVLNDDQKKEYLALQKIGKGQYKNNARPGRSMNNRAGFRSGNRTNQVGNCQGRFKGKRGQIKNKTNTSS